MIKMTKKDLLYIKDSLAYYQKTLLEQISSEAEGGNSSAVIRISSILEQVTMLRDKVSEKAFYTRSDSPAEVDIVDE